MSSIIFTLVGLDGEVVPFTSFKIEAVAPDGVYDPEYIVPAPVIITTDAEGVATVELEATTAPYFITRLSGTIDDFIALKFFVPPSSLPIQAEMLYVDLAKHQKLHTDRALYALIETKVAMLHALNLFQLNQGVASVVSVNGMTDVVVLDASDVGADVSGAAAAAQAAAVQRANHTGTQLANTISDFSASASAAAPVQSVFGRTGAVTAQAGDYTAVQVGADPAGSAATAQANAVQRANHTGTQLAATISDLTSAVLAASPHPLGRYEDESWLVEDFDTFYAVRPFTWSANADVARSAVTGVAAGMADAHGVLRAARTGFAPWASVATGYETNTSFCTFVLSADPIILHASFSVEGWGTDADQIAYMLALSPAQVASQGNPRQDNSCMLIFDWDVTKKATAHTKASGTVTNTSVSHSLAVNSRINTTIVATSTSVVYYVNGTAIATHTANIPTGALCAWFGFCSFGTTGETAGFNIDLLALGRKYVTPRALQLPVGYGG